MMNETSDNNGICGHLVVQTILHISVIGRAFLKKERKDEENNTAKTDLKEERYKEGN